jgi:hypothetical protein
MDKDRFKEKYIRPTLDEFLHEEGIFDTVHGLSNEKLEEYLKQIGVESYKEWYSCEICGQKHYIVKPLPKLELLNDKDGVPETNARKG